MVYRDAEWHERVNARVKSIIESLDPQSQLQNREMDVLAFSGADCCWDERVYWIIGKFHNENEGASFFERDVLWFIVLMKKIKVLTQKMRKL